MSDKNADGQAGREVEPVAWRWRPVGAQTWVYDPDLNWLKKQSGIEKEPLYTPAPSQEGHAAAPDEALIEEIANRATLFRGAGLPLVTPKELACWAIREYIRRSAGKEKG